MPYCPNCLERYRRGVKTCPDCEVELLEGNPPKKESDKPDRLVTIATFPFEELAYLSKAKLESEGIWSMIGSAFTRGSGGLGLFIGGSGIELKVKESDFDEAARILEAAAEANFEEADGSNGESEFGEETGNKAVEAVQDETERCPACNSPDIHTKSFFSRKRQCKNCGHEWERD
jgi:hypothetical protein